MSLPRLAVSFACLASFLAACAASSAVAATKNTPDPARVAELAQMLPKQAQGVGRPAADREAWQAIAKSPGFKSPVARAETLMREPIPDLSDDVYLDFSRTGNRTRGQQVLFGRHGRVPTLVLAECIENRGRFLPAIEEAIRAVCQEKTWVMPAHDRRLTNFNGTVREIDLASAALSWDLATADFWLGDKLGGEVRKLLRSEIERRTFESYEGMIKTGKPGLGWVNTTSNWNAVCLAGVTGAALAVLDSPERRAVFAAAGEKNIQNFLSGFTPDGYCSEGMGYWNYGFGHFLLLAETLHRATGGRLDLMEDPKVRQIALFGQRMEILPGIYPAFADCHLGARPGVRIQAFVSRRYGFGWAELERRGLALTTDGRGNLFEVGIHDFPNSASQRPAAKQQLPGSPRPLAGEGQGVRALQPLRDWFADAGILICRPASESRHALGAALKGGHNAEHHNHNDVGSFVVALGKTTPLLDPGAEVYTARTFSKDRYVSNVLNSFGHPLPRVAGKLQHEGRSAAAKILKTEFTDQADTLVMDIRSAYDVKELKKLQRTFVFSREGSGKLTIVDEVEFSSPQTFGTALITLSKWRASGADRLVIGEGADAVQVVLSAQGAGVRVEPTEIHEELPGDLVPIRLGIELTEPVNSATIRAVVSRKDER